MTNRPYGRLRARLRVTIIRAVKTRARSRLARCPHCGLEMVVFGAQTEKTTLKWHRRRGACQVEAASYYAGLAVPEKAPAG